MALIIGTQLGSYEITALLGKGGMGEVYRARDTKLKREVAIKILPDEFLLDSTRITRFQREAEVLASLNHPNIAAIYDFQQDGETRFLVLEIVEGETLSERIARGPIPIEETIDITKHICEAVEAAHEKGIVHRDLKPANIKITPDGRVKVLDFGLAKAMENPQAAPILSNSPTLTLGATEGGVILGTASYMSPEQAKGFQADTRSDVFSFGSVFYEMLTGRQAFHGESVGDVLASVIAREPDFSFLAANLNPRLQEMLQRCLEKNPKRRWQAVGDLRLELESLATVPHHSATATAQLRSGQSFSKHAIPVLLGMLIVAGVAGIAAWTLKPAKPGTVKRLAITLPQEQQFTRQTQRILDLSPDGQGVVYVANGQLFLRSMAEMEGHPIIGSNLNPALPTFSPDGQWIAFQAQDALKKIAVSGGTAVTLCKYSSGWAGLSWDRNHIVFAEADKGVLRVLPDGGEPELIASGKSQEVLATPQLLNGGKDLLFTLATTTGSDRWDKAQIVVQSLSSGKRKVIWNGGSAAHYLPTGHLVFSVGSTLMAIAFDVAKLEVSGGPIPILDGVTTRGTGSGVQLAFSGDGSVVYIPGVPGASTAPPAVRDLALVDRNGKAQPLGLPPRAYYHPRISPDGRRLVVGTDDGNESIIWVLDDLRGGSALRRLTFGGRNLQPIWTRDGRYITFASDRDGDPGLFRQPADGGSAELLAKVQAEELRPESWHPDGKTLAFSQIKGRIGDILTISGADQKPKPLVQTPANERYSAFSPDGRWLAYVAGASGSRADFQVFVQPFPPTGAEYQITTEGGSNPVWSPDGKQLFYNTVAGPDQTTSTGKLVAVDIRTQPAFSFGQPVPIPITGAILGGIGTNYDITPDGKQFLAVQSISNSSTDATRRANQINVVLNWFRELQERVPVK